MECHGNGEDHCCYAGGVCPALEFDTVPGRHHVCGLRRRLGSWDAVHASPEYQALPVAKRLAEQHPGYGCGDWPQLIPGVIGSSVGLCCFDEAA
jgi:hypothetical protein